MYNSTCNDYPYRGSTPQAYGGGSGQPLTGNAVGEDIVWSAWKHVAVYSWKSKRASVLRHLLNISDKALPIRGANAFLTNAKVGDPLLAPSMYMQLEQEARCEGVILDTLTYLMGNYERKIVNTSSNTMDGWKHYGIFYKELNDLIKMSTKTHIIMAHTDTMLNEQSMQMESRVLVKGAVGKIGVESDHTFVVTTKQMPISKLKSEEYANKYLTFNAQEEATGMKYVFSVQMNKETVGDRTRAPMGFWEPNEQYIDNDIQIILDKWDEFYS